MVIRMHLQGVKMGLKLTYMGLKLTYRGANPKCTGSLSNLLLSEPVHLGSAPLYKHFNKKDLHSIIISQVQSNLVSVGINKKTSNVQESIMGGYVQSSSIKKYVKIVF